MAIVLTFLLILFAGQAYASDVPAWREARIERCARLYTARNRFYNDRGLCFTRQLAKEVFTDNEATCTIKRGQDFPISAREKVLVDRIVAEERSLGCPRL